MKINIDIEGKEMPVESKTMLESIAATMASEYRDKEFTKELYDVLINYIAYDATAAMLKKLLNFYAKDEPNALIKGALKLGAKALTEDNENYY